MMPLMAEIATAPKPLRVLVSEGNSTSAREAITILGLSGQRRRNCQVWISCIMTESVTRSASSLLSILRAGIVYQTIIFGEH
jgi:hypothetical protein